MSSSKLIPDGSVEFLVFHGLSHASSHWILTTSGITFTPTFLNEEMRVLKEALIELALELQGPHWVKLPPSRLREVG